LDNGASHHMIEACDLFNSLMESESEVHVQLGEEAKYAVKGERTYMFHLESGGLLDAHDVVYVLGLKNNFLSILAIEDMGFLVNF